MWRPTEDLGYQIEVPARVREGKQSSGTSWIRKPDCEVSKFYEQDESENQKIKWRAEPTIELSQNIRRSKNRQSY